MTFIADIFEKLTNDPSWPWKFKQDSSGLIDIWGQDGSYICSVYREGNKHTEVIAQSPLTMARLALMVVEEQAGWIFFIARRKKLTEEQEKIERVKWLGKAIEGFGINPKHYANVQKRVADTEDK